MSISKLIHGNNYFIIYKIYFNHDLSVVILGNRIIGRI
nr:MAG TPA: hypothetical protein [Caudoviricetes sp.]